MLSVLTTWTVLGLIFIGMGLLVRRALGLPLRTSNDVLRCFWIGWACAILVLQLWHLGRSTGWGVSLLLALIGGAGLIQSRKELIALIPRAGPAHLLRGALVMLVALYLANLATDTIRNYDTGLYHMQSVRWAASYPLVRGLGNLHGLLAYNSSYFLYAGMLEGGPWPDASQHVANGLLLLVLLLQVGAAGARLLSRMSAPALQDVFAVVLLTPAVRQLRDVTSLSNDTAVFVLGAVISIELAAVLSGTKSRDETGFSQALILTLAAVGVTVKLSLMFLALPAVAIILGEACVRGGWRSRGVVLGTALGALALVTWVGRGILISGYPVYPLTFGACPVEWRVPLEVPIHDTIWIKSWPREPGGDPARVLADWRWLRPWASDVLHEPRKSVLVILPGMLAALFGSLALVRFLRGRCRVLPVDWLVVPPVVAMVLWFFSAPDPRHAAGSFWFLAAACVVLAVARLADSQARALARLVASGSVLSAMACILWFGFQSHPYDHRLVVKADGRHGLSPAPRVGLRPFITDSGLVVNVPLEGNQCWGALACAPNPSSKLRLRRRGELASGFVLDF